MGTRRVICAVWLAVAALATGCSTAPESRSGEVHIDFRGRPLPPEFRTSGPLKPEYLRPEPEGLRVTLPKERDNLDAVKFDLPTSVKGDCEVTATIDILEAERPFDAGGALVGVYLAINQAVRVGQLTRVTGPQLVWEQWRTPDGSRNFTGRSQPLEDKARRLRVKRIGPMVYFLWSPAAEGHDFREIGACEFGDEDVTLVRLIAQTGQRNCKLDVRFADLRVTGASVAVTSWRRPWLVVAAVAVGVLVLALALRRRRRKPLAGLAEIP